MCVVRSATVTAPYKTHTVAHIFVRMGSWSHRTAEDTDLATEERKIDKDGDVPSRILSVFPQERHTVVVSPRTRRHMAVGVLWPDSPSSVYLSMNHRWRQDLPHGCVSFGIKPVSIYRCVGDTPQPIGSAWTSQCRDSPSCGGLKPKVCFLSPNSSVQVFSPRTPQGDSETYGSTLS